MQGPALRACAPVFLGIMMSVMSPAVHAAERDTVQFCWTIGRYDQTAYYAEAADRADRSADFAALLDLSALDPGDVYCVRNPAAHHAAFKRKLIQQWRDSELDVVNTTFMSDLDF